MAPLKNWDNKTWLSSQRYILSFNRFILKQIKLDRNSRVLDIGCGRGKIISNLSNKLKLHNKPIGIDIEKHKDKSKKIIFKKTDALSFVSKTKINFDLILIKQTIHLVKKNQINKLLLICKNKLNTNGKIIILSLKQSLKRDKSLFQLIKKINTNLTVKKFIFNVKISKNKYLQMIKNRYISTLLNFTEKQIQNGLNEIDKKYKKKLNFKDQLICLIIKNN